MFKVERCYDLSELLRHNMHTHTYFSRCAKPEMDLQSMIRAAEQVELKTIAITDHSDLDDGIDTYGNTLLLRTLLSQIETPVRVLIGSELSLYGIGKFSESRFVEDALDFRSFTHSHYHLSYWEHPEDKSPEGYAKHMIAMLESLFQSGRADNVAHPFTPVKLKYIMDEDKRNRTMEAITDNMLGDILEKGERAECSWELHMPSILFCPTFYRRMWTLGKEIGVHFAFGTDAHALQYIDTTPFLPQITDILK